MTRRIRIRTLEYTRCHDGFVHIRIHRMVHDASVQPPAFADIYGLQQQLSFTGVHPGREMPVSNALSASRKTGWGGGQLRCSAHPVYPFSLLQRAGIDMGVWDGFGVPEIDGNADDFSCRRTTSEFYIGIVLRLAGGN